ncbi:MAG TPA: matrixin family metalloprotease [Polyangiaceae bacterium]|nr:matrixin family metalloprotease [Polyangiaceae bacterium]
MRLRSKTTRRDARGILFLAAIGLSFFGDIDAASAFCRAKTCGNKCAADENECPIGAVPIAWPGSCLSYSVQEDGSPSISRAQVSFAADAAFRAWQEAQCPSRLARPTLTIGDVFGPARCGRVEYNPGQANANIIVIRESWEAGQSDALALTTVTYGPTTGEIYDADIEINGSEPISTEPMGVNFYDLQSILTHEAGHFLGLAHSKEGVADNCVGGPTMCARYAPGVDDFRTLEADDVAGICAVYPPERNVPACDPRPRMGFSPECGLDPVSGGGCSLAIARVRPSSRGMTVMVLGFGLVVRRLRRVGQRAQKLTYGPKPIDR